MPLSSKERFRDTMYQLSLCCAWKWGLTQGKASRPLDVFRRELYRVSEDLRDPAPLAAWLQLCETMVREGLQDLPGGPRRGGDLKSSGAGGGRGAGPSTARLALASLRYHPQRVPDVVHKSEPPGGC